MNKEAAARIADRYIGRDGGAPRRATPEPSQPGRIVFAPPPVRVSASVADAPPGGEAGLIMDRPSPSDQATALAAVLFFIGAHHPRDREGGWTAVEALAGLVVLTGIPADTLCQTIGWEKPR